MRNYKSNLVYDHCKSYKIASKILKIKKQKILNENVNTNEEIYEDTQKYKYSHVQSLEELIVKIWILPKAIY